MKTKFRPLGWLVLVVTGALFVLPETVEAFPPAPSHQIYGLVRNEYGEPLSVSGAQITLESTTGVQVSSIIVPGLDAGVNYRLNLSMDSGVAPDSYKPTALRPTLPFLIRVKIGQATYLPIEMSGNFSKLGIPAASTRIDLTLGIDADHDGLPDAWQQLIRAMLGPNAKIGPNEDADGDGISNLDEYRFGTFAFIPNEGFRLKLINQPGAKPLLEFTVATSHAYTVHSSTNLQTWTPLLFKIPANGPADSARSYFTATDVQVLQVEPQLPAGATNANYFFKVQVQ
jgi:hypothetical protein